MSLTAGFIAAYAGANPPTGWLPCDGRAVKRSDYPELFEAIGTAYGEGDGSTTFNLPDLRGRFALGAGVSDYSRSYARGAKGGEHEHLLAQNETGFKASGDEAKGYGLTQANAFANRPAVYSNPVYAHNNMPPYTAVNYVISTGKER